MSTPQPHLHAEVRSDDYAFGHLLRETRGARKLSQLDLAVEAGISQRHLSFLESGRARPSRAMVLQLAESLELPLRVRNRLLVAAGFAPVFPQRPLDSEAMAPVRQALERLLAHHEPFPALVMDRGWNIVMTNRALDRLTAVLGDPDALWRKVCGDGPRNMLKLTFHPQGLRPLISNMTEVGAHLLARARLEALEEPAVARLLDEILAYPDIPSRWKLGEVNAHPPPVLATQMRLGELRLNLFTMLSTFGTPQDLTTDSLRLEHLFPADAESEALLRRLAQS
ncbi:MAG: helix-turn-helix transcriptional regulator [Nevskia sp.]|nr:helix-turn-helix transcriptional regulator [Nevskia sp.]